jgi:hypothetical protein
MRNLAIVAQGANQPPYYDSCLSGIEAPQASSSSRKTDCQFYSKPQPRHEYHRVRLCPYGLGWPTTFSVGRSPVGGGNGGHVEMAVSLMSTRLLKVQPICWKWENSRQTAIPRFPSHFHRHEGKPPVERRRPSCPVESVARLLAGLADRDHAGN